MRGSFLRVLGIALLMDLAAYGQSLGDIARENREKQNPVNGSRKQPAVITNDDLGKDPQGNDAQPPAGAPASKKSAHRLSGEQHPLDQRAAKQWKRQILAQEDKIASLQARIDQLNLSIHPAGGAQFEGPSNRYQARQLERVAELHLQLDEQKRKLDEMQEQARHAGIYAPVYDP